MRVPLASATPQRIIHRFDRTGEVPARGHQQPESSHPVRFPARVVHLCPEGERTLEPLARTIQVAHPDPDLSEQGLRISEERGPALALREIPSLRQRVLRSLELVPEEVRATEDRE